ncbi:hypothetical protein [Cyanobium sp. ATX-6F1]
MAALAGQSAGGGSPGGPPLNLVDVTLLVAGGFVVLGDLVTPW